MVADQETIIRRVRALLALAKSSNPNEAAAAAAKAQALMFEFNLAESQVEEKPADPIAAYKRNIAFYDRMAFRRDRTWMRALMGGIARNNFCACYFSTSAGTSGNGISLLGRPANIEFCRELFSYLCDQLDAYMVLARDAYNQQCARDGEEPIHGTRFRNNFYAGAVDVIERRLAEQRRKNERDSDASMALIVLTGKELIEAERRIIGKVKHHNLFKDLYYNRDAYTAGKTAGERVSILPGSRQVEE